jgi:DNA-binding PadR family transcriptional regulator
MEEAGWIRAEWIAKDSGRRARAYELTAAGKKQLLAEAARWQAVTSAVKRVLRTV